MTRKIASPAYVIVAIACLILAGCSDSTKPHPRKCENCLLPRTSPHNVLNNLRIIYSVADDTVNTPEDAHALAAKYRELFHPDFKFYFIPGDQPPGFPEGWWGRDDEVAAFDSLMVDRAAGIVTDVRLSWSPGAVVPDNRMTNPPPPEVPALLHPDWMHINVTSILLDIVTPNTTYRVSNGQADFYFAPDPADTTLWVITEWYDDPSSGVSPNGVRSRSSGSTLLSMTRWGRIKALFR